MRRFWDFLVYGIVVAGILVLTRPGSQGPQFVTSIGQGIVGFVLAITGSAGSYGGGTVKAGSNYRGQSI